MAQAPPPATHDRFLVRQNFASVTPRLIRSEHPARSGSSIKRPPKCALGLVPFSLTQIHSAQDRFAWSHRLGAIRSASWKASAHASRSPAFPGQYAAQDKRLWRVRLRTFQRFQSRFRVFRCLRSQTCVCESHPISRLRFVWFSRDQFREHFLSFALGGRLRTNLPQH